MRRGISILILLIAAQVTLAQPPSGTYRVAIYDNPPLIKLQGERTPEGIFPEFLESLKLGGAPVQFRYEAMPFSTALQKLESGEIDILASIAMTYDRQKKFLFNKIPLLLNRAILYRNVNIPFAGVEDIAGKSVAVVTGDVHYKAFQDFCNIYGVQCNFIEVAEYEEAFHLLRSGQVDLAVFNLLYTTRMPSSPSIVSTQILFNPIGLRFAFRTDIDPLLIGWIDQQIETQKAEPNSPLNRAMARYLSPRPEVEIPDFVWFLLALLAILIVIVTGFNHILQKKVEEKTRDLKKERDRAEAANISKSHFLANINHEIRTPLNGILGFSQLLDMQEKMSEEEREWVSAIIDSSKKLEKVIAQILHYSALVSGKNTVKVGVLDIVQTYQEVVEALSLRSDMDVSRLAASFSSVSGTLYLSDASCWYLIMDHLLSNALRYSKSSKVKVAAREKTADQDLLLQFTVEDQGPGIPKGKIEHILLPFEQLDMSSTRAYEGLGLGLSLVQATVHQLKGSIKLESPGKGLTVTVEIPVKRAEDTSNDLKVSEVS